MFFIYFSDRALLEVDGDGVKGGVTGQLPGVPAPGGLPVAGRATAGSAGAVPTETDHASGGFDFVNIGIVCVCVGVCVSV